jgi:hypothetical protein
VAKVNASGTSLVYAGYIGGFETDAGSDIAVDDAGNAYVTGATRSGQLTFPVTGSPADPTFNGSYDAFVAAVNPSGSGLLYAGYIGGAGSDKGYGIAVDRAGNAYVTGWTESDASTFPVRFGPGRVYRGGRDAFVAKVSPMGRELLYAGYIGGANDDEGYGVAVDASAQAYVVGNTGSNQSSFPVRVGPDLTFNGAGAARRAAPAMPSSSGQPGPTSAPSR